MRAQVVTRPAGYDGQVGLRFVIEGQRRMQARMPPGAEGRRERLTDVGGDRGMRAALGLPDHEQPIQEIEALADEHAEVYKPVILHPPQATGLHIRLDHRSHGYSLSQTVSSWLFR